MREGDCKHYPEFRDKACDAGVNMRKLVGGPDLGWATRLPCLPSIRKLCSATVSCEKFEAITALEAKAHEEDVLAMLEKAKEFDQLIGELKAKFGKQSAGGTCPCPVCGGTVVFRVSGYNGHVALHCDGEDCVSMME